MFAQAPASADEGAARAETRDEVCDASRRSARGFPARSCRSGPASWRRCCTDRRRSIDRVRLRGAAALHGSHHRFRPWHRSARSRPRTPAGCAAVRASRSPARTASAGIRAPPRSSRTRSRCCRTSHRGWSTPGATGRAARRPPGWPARRDPSPNRPGSGIRPSRRSPRRGRSGASRRSRSSGVRPIVDSSDAGEVECRVAM